MPPTNPGDSRQTYRIGAVARLTGIPTDTLRVWERRYDVVVPLRSEKGVRLYASEDVGRLTLIKRLVDGGDAISHVAPLTLEQLRRRLHVPVTPSGGTQQPKRLRLVVAGASLAALAAQVPEQDPQIELIDYRVDSLDLQGRAAIGEADLLLLERPTIQAEHIGEIKALQRAAEATRVVVVYGFSARTLLSRLESEHVMARRAPLDLAQLRDLCAGFGAAVAIGDPASAKEEDGLGLGEMPPPRRFDSARIARIASHSPSVRCECPQHLVQLLTSLAAFEDYSLECENRDAEDAALHAYLHQASGQARAVIERALDRVVEAEGISLDGDWT